MTLSQTSGSLIVTCPIAGGDVVLDSLPGSQYTGTLTCPPSNVVCTGNPCDRNTCSNQGACNPGDGTCKCNAGYYGTTPYDCANKYCPLGRSAAGNMTQCAGHARCDASSGLCLDESGQPGCFVGWTSSGSIGTCATRGCPSRVSAACNNNTGGSCECSGYGACNGTTGACACIPGRIGNDCFQTDCPGTPRCSGSAGVCDTARGVCACAASAASTAFVGAACEAVFSGSLPPATSLYFIGEVDPTTNVGGAVSVWAILSRVTFLR